MVAANEPMRRVLDVVVALLNNGVPGLLVVRDRTEEAAVLR